MVSNIWKINKIRTRVDRDSRRTSERSRIASYTVVSTLAAAPRPDASRMVRSVCEQKKIFTTAPATEDVV